jgi:hypothetical protein
MDSRQLATILAALRYWQRDMPPEARIEDDIASDGRTLVPLTDEEIDELCEALNFGEVVEIA